MIAVGRPQEDGGAIFLFLMRWAPNLAYSVASLNASAPLRVGDAGGTITDVTLLVLHIRHPTAPITIMPMSVITAG